MNQTYIAPALPPGLEVTPPGYPRSMGGAGPAADCAVMPEGEKISLLCQSRRRTGLPPAVVWGC